MADTEQSHHSRKFCWRVLLQNLPRPMLCASEWSHISAVPSCKTSSKCQLYLLSPFLHHCFSPQSMPFSHINHLTELTLYWVADDPHFAKARVNVLTLSIFSAALDAAGHTLLQTLFSLSFWKTTISWFSSYLNNTHGSLLYSLLSNNTSHCGVTGAQSADPRS